MRRLIVVAVCAAMMVIASFGTAFAGEVTGNGKSLKIEDSKWDTGLHARSFCAYSGQEDDQFKPGGSKGDPGHAQSWGQIPKDFRDFLTSIGEYPGNACNPNGVHLEE